MSRVTDDVIVAVLQDPTGESFEIARRYLRAEDFRLDVDRRLWAFFEREGRGLAYTALAKLFGDRLDADVLRRANDLFAAGVADFANLPLYAKAIAEDAAMREVAAAGSELASEPGRYASVLSRVNDALLRLAPERTSVSGRELYESLQKDLDRNIERELERRVAWDRERLFSLNETTLGAERGVMHVLAARTSVGKTALALQVAYAHASKPEAGRVLYVSIEMPTKMLRNRLVSSLSGISRRELTLHVGIEDWLPRADEAGRALAESSLEINDSARRIDEIESLVSNLAARSRIDMLVVDYLQQVAPDRGLTNASRHVQIAEISARLIDLARRHDFALVALAQIRRSGSGSPSLADLRESGSIEQDARTVVLMHRPAAVSQSYEALAGPTYPPCMAWLNVAKNSEGEPRMIPVHFDGKRQRFFDFIDDCDACKPDARSALAALASSTARRSGGQPPPLH